MKHKVKIISITLMAVLVLLLCVVVNRPTVVGTWQCDSTFDIAGIYAPFEHATILEFKPDGTLVVTTDSEISTYKYSTTDDTITIQGETASWGVYYELQRENLNIKTGGGFSTFTKQVADKN